MPTNFNSSSIVLRQSSSIADHRINRTQLHWRHLLDAVLTTAINCWSILTTCQAVRDQIITSVVWICCRGNLVSKTINLYRIDSRQILHQLPLQEIYHDLRSPCQRSSDPGYTVIFLRHQQYTRNSRIWSTIHKIKAPSSHAGPVQYRLLMTISSPRKIVPRDW